MSTPDQPLPSASLTREEVARIEVGHTAVTPAVRRTLVALFLAAIAAVPAIELAASGMRRAADPAGPWSQLAGIPALVGSYLTGPAEATVDAGAWRRVVSANRQVLSRLSEFERALDDESVLGRTLRQPAQVLMTRGLGAGNERVYPGRDGWLFYREDVEYITGPGFLDAAQMRRRAAAADEWVAPPQPDPRLAILRFRDDLRDRGIALILVPTPVKPAIHPGMLARRSVAEGVVLQNASYAGFIEELTRAGVMVFDPSAPLAVEGRRGLQYLVTDTHWRPEAMEMVAERLAGFIGAGVALPDLPDPGYRVERAEAANVGDTARMLDLPDDRPLFRPEAVWLRRVLRADGSLWRSSPDADVLLLGDSFSNIYTLESMGWGTSAGFVEQLSLALRRPLDRIVQNDAAASATREILRGDAGRLDGKRLVVYQFAVRELAFGDWKILDLPPERPE